MRILFLINRTQLRTSKQVIKTVSIKLLANKRVSEPLKENLVGNLLSLMNKRVSSRKWHITLMGAPTNELSTSLASALLMTTWPLMISMSVLTLFCRKDRRRLSNSTQQPLKMLKNQKIPVKLLKINEDKTLLIWRNKIVCKSRILGVWIHRPPPQTIRKWTQVKRKMKRKSRQRLLSAAVPTPLLSRAPQRTLQRKVRSDRLCPHPSCCQIRFPESWSATGIKGAKRSIKDYERMRSKIKSCFSNSRRIHAGPRQRSSNFRSVSASSKARYTSGTGTCRKRYLTIVAPWVRV